MWMWFIGVQETRAVPLDEARPLALGNMERVTWDYSGTVCRSVGLGPTHIEPSTESRSIVCISFLSSILLRSGGGYI